MNLDRRVQNLEQRVDLTEPVDKIVLVGIAPGEEPTRVSEAVIWTRDGGAVSANTGGVE